VTPARLKRLCLSFPGATEEFPFSEGLSVFKVAGKMFALTRLSARPLAISLKCEPELAEQLRATYPAVAPGYHLNKRHWNTVELDGSIEYAVHINELLKEVLPPAEPSGEADLRNGEEVGS